ncbi:MAG: hypothetical protein CMI53_00160 [Parcubacteria group bacterium]|nr:hypothetical protein [Parcubacteria group bacterium]
MGCHPWNGWIYIPWWSLGKIQKPQVERIIMKSLGEIIAVVLAVGFVTLYEFFLAIRKMTNT